MQTGRNLSLISNSPQRPVFNTTLVQNFDNNTLNGKISVSAVIPAYNSASTILRAIDSVNNQTAEVSEIIVIDDGSTDKTFEIVSDYISKNPKINIKLLKQPNAGPSAARNRGILNSKGDLIAFLDADDEWMPLKTEIQLELFNQYGRNLYMVGCLTSHNLKYNLKKHVVEIDFSDLLWRNFFLTPTVMVWRDVLLEEMFDHRQRFSEDYNLWLRIAVKGRLILINESLVKLADKPTFGHSGLSANLWKMEKGELHNYSMLFKNDVINLFQYLWFSSFSFIKYTIRYMLTVRK